MPRLPRHLHHQRKSTTASKDQNFRCDVTLLTIISNISFKQIITTTTNQQNMSQTSDKHLLMFLCSEYEADPTWNFKKYKEDILGFKETAAEPQAIRDRLSKWKKLKHQDLDQFKMLCTNYDLYPNMVQDSTAKAFFRDCGDKIFCQYTCDCDPKGLDVFFTQDGRSVKLRYPKAIVTDARERLRMCKWGKQPNNYIVKCVQDEQEKQNRSLTRDDFHEELTMFHFNEQVLTFFVDPDGNQVNYEKSLNGDNNAVITFCVMKASHVFQRMTSPTNSLVYPSVPAAQFPRDIHIPTGTVDPTKSTAGESQSSQGSTGSGETKSPSLFNRLGISPMMMQKPATMEVDKRAHEPMDMDELAGQMAQIMKMMMEQQAK